jgi:hypothetical protein
MDGIGKNVAFVNTMFPYKGLNEDLYNTRIQEIGKVIDPEFKLNPSEPKQEPVVASTHSKVSHTPQRPESPKDSVLLKITLRTKFNNNETFILSDDGSYINDKGDTFTIKEEDKVVTNGQKEKVTMLSFNNNILSSPKEVPVQHFETISTDAVKQELVSIDTITKGGGKLKMSKISPLTFMCIYQNRELTVLLTDEQEQELLSGETGEVKVIINGKQPRGIVISDIETTIKRPIASGNTPKGSGPKPCIKCGKYPCECFAPKR